MIRISSGSDQPTARMGWLCKTYIGILWVYTFTWTEHSHWICVTRLVKDCTLSNSDGKYCRKWVSILVSILRYPSKNPHHELHFHKLITNFDVFRLSDFEFFRFLRLLTRFRLFHFRFFFWHFWSLFQWQYQVSIPKYGITTIPEGIETISIVWILFHTTIGQVVVITLW